MTVSGCPASSQILEATQDRPYSGSICHMSWACKMCDFIALSEPLVMYALQHKLGPGRLTIAIKVSEYLLSQELFCTRVCPSLSTQT